MYQMFSLGLLTDDDSHLHGCLPLPNVQQTDEYLPEQRVVYIVTHFVLDSLTKLRFHSQCTCGGTSILSTYTIPNSSLVNFSESCTQPVATSGRHLEAFVRSMIRFE